MTESTITDKEKLKEELYNIKEKGYAISFGERVSGVCSISAPILNRWDEVIAGISISAPLVRVNDSIIDDFISSIKEVANQISNKLKFSD
jgi:IclR family KDG regulon transcriptional repressor